MEETVLNLIMHTGEARMYAAEAISSAKSNDYIKAKKLIQKANEELILKVQSFKGKKRKRIMKYHYY